VTALRAQIRKRRALAKNAKNAKEDERRRKTGVREGNMGGDGLFPIPILDIGVCSSLT
jgi:hypothetical protein